MEKYNSEIIRSSPKNVVGIIRNEWTVVVYKMTDTSGYYDEYPPSPEFYRVKKTFHLSGMLKSKMQIIGEYTAIGESVYYDEQGNILKKVDEDAKFGKIKLDWILQFIEKEGHIDLSTGEGREYAIVNADGDCQIVPSRFSLVDSEGEQPFWIIQITPQKWNNFYKTVYHLNKDTGEVLFKESERVIMRR